MMNISIETFQNLIDRVVKDKVEVHIEMTSENVTVDVQPWEPIKMHCPYGRTGESE